MIIEISVALIALAILTLVPFVIALLIRTQKTMRCVKRDLHNVSIEAVRLMQKLDLLTNDLKLKSESLNFMFRPLKSLSKKSHEGSDIISEVTEWVGISMSLYDKVKALVRHYGK